MFMRFSRQLLVFSLIAVLSTAAAADDEKKAKPHFTVGKATTFVDGPLDKDGRIDYAAALNERLGKGVTPQDNAAVLLWQAIGPNPMGYKDMPAEFVKLMGMEAPPKKGEYFIDFTSFIKEKIKPSSEKIIETFQAKLDRAKQRPWTAEEEPEISAWLKAMEKPLALVVEATKRKQYYSPLWTKTEQGTTHLLSEAPLTLPSKCREIASALTARAMLKIGKGEAVDAWADLQTCHRLSRHVGRGRTMIEYLTAAAIDNFAYRGDLAFLDRTKLDAQQLEACQRDLQKLPPIAQLADIYNLGERLIFLDVVMKSDKIGGLYMCEMLAGGDGKNTKDFDEQMRKVIEWDPAFELGNQWFDRIVDALHEKSWATRMKKFGELDEDFKTLRAKAARANIVLLMIAVKPDGKAMGLSIGEMLFCLMSPVNSQPANTADRYQQTHNNVTIAFAMARYRLDNGNYPPDLVALAPKYVKNAPVDLFSGKPLIYMLTEKGYCFYSVGINGKDDGGRGYYDDPRGDDLPVRMPLTELPKK